MAHRLRLTYQSKILITLSIVLLVICSIVLTLVLTRGNTTSSQEQAAQITPDFQTFLPNNTSISELGGWQKLTPPSGVSYYVFNDTIDTIPITVSQQQLPDSFKTNPSESIQELATAYSASETFEVNDIKVYLGNSAKGPQSVIFTKSDVLILILSENKISEESWKKYISSLS